MKRAIPNEKNSIKQLIKVANSIPVDIKMVINILQEKWVYPDYICVKGKRLFLSTGGWSEHEYIINELSKTLFWRLYWYQSNRGGHYRFIFDRGLK